MFGKSFVSVGALVSLVTTTSAQSAPGFPVSASTPLTVVYGNNTVSPPGELIPRGETAQPPRISPRTWAGDENGARSAVLLMVDLDVPRNGTRVQLLHWLATDVTRATANSSSESALLISSAPVPYLQPSPPVGDVPHSYTFILFAQPANFSIPAQYAELAQNRVGFNTSQFLKDAGVAESSALGANYIRVQNLTGTPTTTYPPARPTQSAAQNSSAPSAFPGAGQPLQVGGSALWAGLSTALLAGVAAVGL
ncbi:phosphatidylethanolamine-binding protein [Ampelomyces quisqualis]|uniref:Phosphatidylethanolamine-binding protein n=1 Tax=Ampelomyces quisqualis TaxID=50730 RepID=A0A6A5QYP2_AMPQU|nr:phosphatidylethanolamine-binding protein [Ampelomyces quisqualis]